MTATAVVEIQDEAGKWFVDCENQEPMALDDADSRVKALRALGFKARARLVE